MPHSSAATLTAVNPLERFRHLAVISGSQRPIPLVSTKFSVRVLGAMALVTAERSFRNAEDRSIEATMTFPVPVHAALVGMTARIDGRTLVASTKRKKQARATYEQAMDDGKTAVLHEEALRGIHMISVGHVPPGKEVTVSGIWAMPLQASSGGTRLSIPTTVGDVYGRSPLADSDDLVHAAVRLEAEVVVSCDGGIARLVDGTLVDGMARVALDRPIEIEVTGSGSRTLHGTAADGQAVELTIDLATAGQSDLDVVLLEDISGSMSEPSTGRYDDRDRVPSKHDVAMRGLGEVAAGLRPADRLDIWEFNGNARHVGSGTGPAGAALAATRISLPNGGTELGRSIETVLAEREGADILLVGDGKTHALDVHALARRGARFTVILVGEDSLAANVGHLAALTGGQVFVSSGLDLADVLRMAFASMRTPRLHQSKVAKGARPQAAGALTGGMFAAARWTEASKIAAPAAQADGQGALMPIEPGDSGVSRAVAAYAAWLALPLMEEEDAAALAEAEGLVCHLTSMVLVDEAGEAQQGIPGQRKVPLMSPSASHMMPMMEMAFSAGGGATKGLRSMATLAASASPGGALRGSKGLFRQAAVADGLGGGGIAAAPADDQWLDAPSFDRGRSAHPAGPVPPSPNPFRANLGSIKGRVNWGCDLDALQRGELHGNVPLDALVHLRAAARLAEVVALATALGVTAEAVAVALLARSEGGSDRGAARLARAVLGSADEAALAAATRAVGL